MSLHIRVSRHGLTRCPACKQHIRLAPEIRETSCPFCSVSLVATASAGGLGALARGVAQHSRSSLLAASLLGLATLTGCGSDEEEGDTSTADVITDTSDVRNDVAIYGLPPEDVSADTNDADVTTDTSDVRNDVAVYGLPPEDVTTDTNNADVSTDTVEDFGAALYGLPPTDTTP